MRLCCACVRPSRTLARFEVSSPTAVNVIPSGYLADYFFVSFGSSPQKDFQFGIGEAAVQEMEAQQVAKQLAVWTGELRPLGLRRSTRLR